MVYDGICFFYAVKEAVSVVVVQKYGCIVITSVVAHWLVSNRIQPKEFDLAQLKNEATVKCECSTCNSSFSFSISCHIGQSYLLRLFNELQFTLSREKVLAYMIWDIICIYSETQVCICTYNTNFKYSTSRHMPCNPLKLYSAIL